MGRRTDGTGGAGQGGGKLVGEARVAGPASARACSSLVRSHAALVAAAELAAEDPARKTWPEEEPAGTGRPEEASQELRAGQEEPAGRNLSCP